MGRLRREDATARTRQRLLDAAEQVFAARGFAAASLEQIAEDAGFSRGALYYNFSGKDELFVAVLSRRIDVQIAEIGDLRSQHPDPADFLRALRARADQRRRSTEVPRWALLNDEFWLYTVRNPKARAKLAEHHRHLRAAYGGAITATFQQLGMALPPEPIDHLAAVVFALDAGLPRQHWVDPEAIPDGLFFDVLALLIEAFQALDQVRSGTRR